MSAPRHSGALRRGFAAAGALGCALAVGLGAFAAHGLEGTAQVRLAIAVLVLFLHGLALCVLAPLATGRLALAALVGWSAGSVLFCGSLVFSAMLGTGTALAPFGGIVLILGWILQAIAPSAR